MHGQKNPLERGKTWSWKLELKSAHFRKDLLGSIPPEPKECPACTMYQWQRPHERCRSEAFVDGMEDFVSGLSAFFAGMSLDEACKRLSRIRQQCLWRDPLSPKRDSPSWRRAGDCETEVETLPITILCSSPADHTLFSPCTNYDELRHQIASAYSSTRCRYHSLPYYPPIPIPLHSAPGKPEKGPEEFNVYNGHSSRCIQKVSGHY